MTVGVPVGHRLPCDDHRMAGSRDVQVVGDELIRTDRLDLHLITVDALISLFREPGSPLPYEGRPYRNPRRVLIDDPGPLHWRVPQVEANPAINRWLVRFIVERSSQEAVGSISFHAPPDERGMVEVGLGVEPGSRGRGYATEALLGMWAWACRQPEVRTLRYTVSPTNGPSVAIIGSYGFTHVGQQIDEIDGPEDIYEMSVEEFRSRWLTT